MFISVWMVSYWFWLAFLHRELSVFLMSWVVLPIALPHNFTISFMNHRGNFVLNTSYLIIAGHDYQFLVQALLQVL